MTGFWTRTDTYFVGYHADYDCAAVPTGLDLPRAQRLMQLHRRCAGRQCIPRARALTYLILEGHLTPEARSAGRKGKLV